MSRGRVLLDLVAAQSPSYRGRGVARHALEFAEAVSQARPDLLEAVVLHEGLPMPTLEGTLATPGKVTTSPMWDAHNEEPGGGILHLTSVFEPELSNAIFWPKQASVGRRSLVVTVYDLIPEVMAEMYLADPGLRRRWRACRETVRAADRVFALSDSGASDIIERLGVDSKRVTVIGAGCSSVFDRRHGADEAFALVRSQLPKLRRGFLVYNGAGDPRKNLERLLEAYAQLPETIRCSHQLVIACHLEPSQRNHIEVRSSQLGISQHVLLSGFVSDQNLADLYRCAHLSVFPSLYEGYGLPVVEALACGCPVIASGNSSLAELVPPEATFDPYDIRSMSQSIMAALTDIELRNRLAVHALKPAPTWRSVAERACEVYDQLIERSTRLYAAGLKLPGWRPSQSTNETKR